MLAVAGLCSNAAAFTVNDANDLPQVAGRSGLTGLPVWRVSEPYINLWIEDVPLSYQPARGPRISFGVAFKQRGPRPFAEDLDLRPRVFGVGNPWACSWLSYVAFTDSSPTATVYFGGGGSRAFTADGGTVDYLTNTKLSKNMSGGVVSSFERLHANGAKEVFAMIIQGTSQTYAFRTAIIDPAGIAVQFGYTTYTDGSGKLNLRLATVTDADGRNTSFGYGNGSFPNQITQITDPFGRSASIAYDGSGRLVSIWNMGSLYASFGYTANDWVTTMSTAYGTTSFNFFGPSDANAEGRAVIATTPDGTRELYAYRDGLTGVLPYSYSSDQVPNTGYLSTFDNTAVYDRNSFHWNRKQYAALSQTFRNTLNIYDLTVDDFRKGSLSRWLKETGSEVSATIALVREASPDGTAEGQKTWFDYDNQPAGDTHGTQLLPRTVAQVLPEPGNPTSFARYQRNAWGKVLQEISSFTDPNSGAVATRTSTLSYSPDGIDLLEVRGPNNQALRSYTYNANHQVLTLAEKPDAQTTYTTTYTYDPTYRQLTSVARADGATTSYSYTWDRRVSQISQQPTGRTESFTYYSNGQLYSHTDARGAVRQFYWDNLDRPTQIYFTTDWTYVQNSYNRLDLSWTRDRLGYYTYFYYNSLGQLTQQTDPLNRYTYFSYSLCGPVETVTNPLGQLTRFDYDNLGRRTRVTYPDGKTESFSYNALSQLTARFDHSGNQVENYFYNNQGLFTGVKTPSGQIRSQVTHDIQDRPWRTTDINGPTVTQVYDELGRLDTQTVANGGGVSTMDYSAKGLEDLNQQISPAFTRNTRFSYDYAARRITQTDALQNTAQIEFNTSGDLTRLVDQRQRSTYWNYDLERRPTSKVNHLSQTVLSLTYDASGRVTSRWTPARGATYFSYDAVGNLTFINYPNSTDVTFYYDSLNRLSGMSDATGYTGFSYTASGHLASEDGPWTSDTLTYSYDLNRWRSTMNLSQPTGTTWTQTYQYDNRGRLQVLGTPVGTFNYYYWSSAVSDRVASVTLPGIGWINYSYDGRGLLSWTEFLQAPNTVIDRLSYTYNEGGQRIRETRPSNYVDFAYDNLGRLATARGYESGGAQRRHEWLSYNYDAAGNLSYRGNDQLSQNFYVEDRNRLTSASHSGLLTVAGMAGGSLSSVTVNGQSASLYADGSFASAPMSVTSVYTAYASGAGGSASDTISVNLPSSVSFWYDANGNLTWDGKRSFTFDDENRLVMVEIAGAWQTQFAYDGLGRRKWRREYSWNSGYAYWQYAGEVRYVYDGPLVIQERDQNNNVTANYVRGLDRSETLDGAGGIGGLLARQDGYGTVFYFCDANGNVRALMNQNQQVVARYLYDPYGNMIGQSGGLAEGNLYRFSTKEYHPIHGLYYFGGRYYDPNLQRWLTEDPIQEAGGINLYGIVSNDPINSIDPSGLYEIDVHQFLTWFLARKAGFSELTARRIGLETQRLDAPGSTRDAMYRGVNHKNMELYHFVSYERLGALRWESFRNPSDRRALGAIGVYLHALQDVFSHHKGHGILFGNFGHYYMDTPLNLGHALEGHAPDWTWTDVDKSMAMAKATYDALRNLAKFRGETGNIVEWADIEATVREFVEYEPEQYDHPFKLGASVRTVSFEGYTEKIKKLDPNFELSNAYRQVYWDAAHRAPVKLDIDIWKDLPSLGL